jgi:DNA-binding NarL/FixJ family response regulator
MAISLVQEVFSAGAQGYLLDMPSREELLSALETMREQHIALDVRLRATVEGKRLLTIMI